MNLHSVYWLKSEVFKKLLAERKMSMKKLSEETGLSYSSITQWSSRAIHISLESAGILARYFQVNADDLIVLDSKVDEKNISKSSKKPKTTKNDIHKGLINRNTIMINRIIRCKKTNNIEVILDTLFKSQSILNQTSFLSENGVRKFIKEHKDEIRWYEK